MRISLTKAAAAKAEEIRWRHWLALSRKRAAKARLNKHADNAPPSPRSND